MKSSEMKPNDEEVADSLFQLGTALSTESVEFPFVIYTGRIGQKRSYLFPRSLLCVGYMKCTERNKIAVSASLRSGDAIQFVPSCDGIVMRYEKSRQFTRDAFDGIGSTVHINDHAVFSPETPRRCWTRCHGITPCTIDAGNAVPNLVYDVNVVLNPFFVEPEQDNDLPVPNVSHELGMILRAVRDNSQIDLVYRAPWNLPDRRIFLPPVDDDYYNFKSEEKIHPAPPKSRYFDVYLYIIGVNQVIWPKKPKYKVVIANPSSSSVRKTMQVGHCVRANLFYCEFNKMYVAYDYTVLLGKNYPPLKTKQLINNEDFAGDVFKVNLKYSRHTGFFVCKQFNFCLVEDTKRLLANAAHKRRSVKPIFPAWIRPNGFESLAKFVVASIDKEDYDADEIWFEIPDVNGTAFLIDNRTGAVFSPEHPLKRIILMIPDRVAIEVGEWFTFEATYCAAKDIFVVLENSPIKSKFAIKAIPWRNGFLFKETLVSTNIMASEKVYSGKNFGLLTDKEDLVMDKAKKDKTAVPSSLEVLVEYNADCRRPTAFNVYALSLNPKEIEAEAPIEFAPTNRWWKSDDPLECKCRASIDLCKDLLDTVDQSLLEADQSLTPEVELHQELKKLFL